MAEIETPEPGLGEVRVRVLVSAVNPTDWKSRSGRTGGAMQFPFVVPHQDGAGTIDAVGPGVDPGRVGHRVWLYMCSFQRQFGSAAQWICLPSAQAVDLPDAASFELGASLGVPAVTAQHALFADGPLAGRTVLVAGGAGAVGHFAIELAKRGGARVVTTVSSQSKAELARSAGADVVVDYRADDAVRAIRSAAPAGVDRVVEVDLASNLDLDMAVCVNGATVMTYAATAHEPTLAVRPLMTANLGLHFMLLYNIGEDAMAAGVDAVQAALVDGALTELPATHFSLDDVADAHRAMETGVVGKVFVDIP